MSATAIQMENKTLRWQRGGLVVTTGPRAIADPLKQFHPRSGFSRLYLAGGGAADHKDLIQSRLPGQSIELIDEGVLADVRGYHLSGLDMLDERQASRPRTGKTELIFSESVGQRPTFHTDFCTLRG